MVEEAVSMPIELTAQSAGDPFQKGDVQPHMTMDRPLEPEPSMLESVAQPKEVSASSLGPKPKPLAQYSIVRPIHTGAAQLEASLMGDLSSESESSALDPGTQAIPTTRA